MHKSMTPWRNARLAVFGLGISVILFVIAMVLPFYSFSYFFQGKVMTFIECMQANKQIAIPFFTIIVALVLQVIGLAFMLLLPKVKICQILSQVFAFVGAFASLAIFIISICRLWVIPYEFEYVAQQSLESGYVFYVIFLFFNGILGCYTTSISGKAEEAI